MKTKTCMLMAALALASTPALAREDHIKVAIQQALAKGLHQLLETVRPNPMDFHAMAQERPAVDRQDGRLMRPLLRELAPPIDKVVKERPGVRTEAGERHLVVRRHENVDVVDLQ